MFNDENSTPASLTANEKQVLEYIETFMAERGIAPSFQEIKNHFGFASFNSVQRYLKQLQAKAYIHIPGGNQKRAIHLLKNSFALKEALHDALSDKILGFSPRRSPTPPHTIGERLWKQPNAVSTPKKSPVVDGPQQEIFSLPMLGKVAAGQPLEALTHDEFTDVPGSMVKNPSRSFTLGVSGQSMIEDGIFDGDILIVQEQSAAKNGEICICEVAGEATVKRFYMHYENKIEDARVELRPANSEMKSMWYSPEQIKIRGIVVGLLRKF